MDLLLVSSFPSSPDQWLVLAKCPQLVQEMVSVLCQLWLFAMQRQGMGEGTQSVEEGEGGTQSEGGREGGTKVKELVSTLKVWLLLR